jgi:hypothetical protein
MGDSEDDTPKWQPLNLRDSPEAATYEALVDGIPDWLENSIWRWVIDRAATGGPALVYKAERMLRTSIPQVSGQSAIGEYWATAGSEARLTLVDFLLLDLQERYERARRELDLRRVSENHESLIRLVEMLREGGSAWQTIHTPYWGLGRRVNETMQAHVDLASSTDTDAARKIASAWNACYRHAPNYDLAYRDAVLAVEAVALAVTLPDNNRGTLGNAVSHIRDTVYKWTVGGLDADQQASGETLLAMLKTLWRNQQRHAQPDGSVVPVSQQEAVTAVSIAVTLVHWFSSSLVARRDS